MGADIVELILRGKASKILIERTITKRQEQDKYENGHQHGYSGDWQSVNSIKVNCTIFKSKTEAEKYLYDTVEKYGPAIVVYYLTKDEFQPTIKTIVQAMVPC